MSFINIARRCFADVNPQAQQQQPTNVSKEKKEEKVAKVDVDITPLLDKTQLANVDDLDWDLPNSFYKELNIDNDDDKLLVVDGIKQLVSLWKICSAVSDRKDWPVNKVNLALYQKLATEVQSRPREKLKLLFTISDSHNHSYVFWLVNPSVIEGRFSCKMQEQTYNAEYSVSNTSVISVKYQDGDEPGDYAIEPIIDEFAKEDKTVKEEAQSILDAQAEAEEGLEEESWMEEDIFGNEGESSEEETDSKETEPKNFSYLQAFFV